MRIEFSAKTDVGAVRKENQDSYGILEERNYFAVCDGMGGGAAGDFASRCAAEIMIKALEKLSAPVMKSVTGAQPFDIPEEYLGPVAAIRLANRGLHNYTQKYPKLAGMGTTVVAVMCDIQNRCLHIYHVGDSRLYRVRDGYIEQLTKDHSKVNELIDQGKMSEAEVKTAEIQSMITRALGTHARVKIDYRRVALWPEDYFVLCSDGLNGELDDRTIRNVMVKNRGDVNAITAELIERTNAAGGRDNTTALAIRAIGENEKPGTTAELLPMDAVTIGEETDEQLQHEDKALKSVLPCIQVQVPKNAHDRALWNNPIVLGIVLTALVSAVAFFPKHVMKDNPDTKLTDLAGRVSGIVLDVRVPLPAQLAAFRRAEDNIQRMQIVQDWYRKKDQLTEPLDKAQVSVAVNGSEQYQADTGTVPMDIRLPVGAGMVRVRYRNYSLIGDRMEVTDAVPVAIEIGVAFKPVTVIMVPER
jgi:protein phosphatase